MGTEKCCNRNMERKPPIRRDTNFNTRQQVETNLKCVFCDGTGYRINDCNEVKRKIQ